MKWAWVPLALALMGATEPATRPARTGSFKLSFTQRSPLSNVSIIAARLGVGEAALLRAAKEKNYRLDVESYDVCVPESYTGQKPYGLLVWVSPGDTVGMVPGWKQVLEKRELIWIGANNAGNDRTPLVRIGLAVDAAHNMKKLYSIDPDRVYVAGLSGGGRISSMVAVGWPELFCGGYYMCGVSYYRPARSTEQGGRVWRPEYLMPPASTLAEARQRRHVLLTGSEDMNREQTQVYSACYQAEGFKHVSYIEVPGMGHRPPEAEWFEKGLALLEGQGESVATTRPAPRRQATAAEASSPKAAAELGAARALAGTDPIAAAEAMHEIARKYPSAREGTEALAEADRLMADPKVGKAVKDRLEADKLVRVAKIYIDNRMIEQARERLKRVIEQYPDTPSAREARETLERIKAK